MKNCVHIYCTKGQQTNEWRIAVEKVVCEEGNHVNEVFRAIRREKGGRWDGVGTNDTEFQKIRFKSSEAVVKYKQGEFDDMDGDLNKKQTREFLKSKSSKPRAEEDR